MQWPLRNRTMLPVQRKKITQTSGMLICFHVLRVQLKTSNIRDLNQNNEEYIVKSVRIAAIMTMHLMHLLVVKEWRGPRTVQN